MQTMNARRALALLLAVAGASCSDGTTMNPGPDAGDNCGGAKAFAYAGTYMNVTASSIMDGCNDNLSEASLKIALEITFDAASGRNVVKNAQSGAEIGSGKVACNLGTLGIGPVVLRNASCQYSVTRTLDFHATADNQVTLILAEQRSNTTQVQGGAQCSQPASCTSGFTWTLSK